MKSFTSRLPALIATGFLVAAITPSVTSATPLDDLRNLWKEWSKVKGTISEEKNNWAREQQSIADAIAVSRQEVELLTSRLKELNSGTTGTEKQRSELLDKIAASKTSIAVFAEAIDKYEAKMRELVPVIPPQLRTELSALLQRLPAEGKPTTLPVSQRIQTVIAFLAQLDKFNSGPTLLSEIKEVEPGKSLEVKTLYFGLGAAYFTDAGATYAGHGYPTLEGWKWTSVDAPTAKRIAEAISIYQNEKQPAFVSLPAQIH
jgi:hypothetical protein